MSRVEQTTNKAGEGWCPRCKSYKAATAFYAVSQRSCGLSGYCKTCTNTYRKERYVRGIRYKSRGGRAHTREQSVVSGANTNARAYGRTETLRVEEWRSVLAKFGERCLSCGTTEGVGIDHVIPLSRGGSNTADNIQPLCTMCNRKKTTQIVDYRVVPPMVIDATMSHIEKRYYEQGKKGATETHMRIADLAEKGLKPDEIALEVGVCTRTVYRIVRGK